MTVLDNREYATKKPSIGKLQLLYQGRCAALQFANRVGGRTPINLFRYDFPCLSLILALNFVLAFCLRWHLRIAYLIS